MDSYYMTQPTFQKKYKTQKIQDLALNKPNQSNIYNNQNNKTLLKTIKHRYYEDIIHDQIEDANIFGSSTFECLSHFRQQQILKKREQKRRNRKPSQNKAKGMNETPNLVDQSIKTRESALNNRPKTAIVSRGTPTRRRLHHKLSLNQIQKAAISQNPLPVHVRQQYFTEQIFDFKPEQNQSCNNQNIRCGSRSATFYKHVKGQNCLKQSQFKKQNKNEEQKFEPSQKRHLIFEATGTKFYQRQKNQGTKNLCKKKKWHLDQKAINKQKMKFRKEIQTHFGNLIKKDGLNYTDERKIQRQKSIIYESKVEGTKTLIQGFNSSKNDWNFRHNQELKANSVQSVSNIFCENKQKTDQTQFKNINFRLQTPGSTEKNKQQECIRKNIQVREQLSLIQKNNKFLLQKQNLSNVNFKEFNQKLCHNTSSSNFQSPIIDAIYLKNQKALGFNTNPYSRQRNESEGLNAQNVYTLTIIFCSSLQSVSLYNIEILQNQFFYKGNALQMLVLVQNLMENKPSSEFVHLILTQSSKIKSKPEIKQSLLFQTFVHNSDLHYFQGRQIQVQYFKYFLRRFISFDASITTKAEIELSLSLILQSEVKTPLQFQEFCREMKIKDNLKVIALKNQDFKRQQVSFKSIQISLSKLLLDANQTVMMIKKELFEGYDWRGVSLAKGTKQFRGYHLEHFYM